MTTAHNFDINSLSLDDKVIIVTGAGNGIGAEVSKTFASIGATIILLDKNIKALEQVYDQIVETGGPTPAIYPIDFKGALGSDYEELAKIIKDNFGRLDGLVHCAASLGQIAPIEHQDTKTWVETLHVNLTAPYLLSKACLPLLKEGTEHGVSSIIFTTDSHKDKAYWSAYGVAKASIESLAKQLADELEAEAKVRVNIIDPGQVKTNLQARAFPGMNPSSLPSPKDIVANYVFLMSPSSETVNGQLIKAQ